MFDFAEIAAELAARLAGRLLHDADKTGNGHENLLSVLCGRSRIRLSGPQHLVRGAGAGALVGPLYPQMRTSTLNTSFGLLRSSFPAFWFMMVSMPVAILPKGLL
ncbi:hypothetical protein ACFSTD_11605 [Novosphingobium colocasiae]